MGVTIMDLDDGDNVASVDVLPAATGAADAVEADD
jgi:hypothetical protein